MLLDTSYYYSPLKDSFFPTKWKEDYVNAGAWPADAVEIPYDIFKEFSLKNNPGKKRVYNNSQFYWEDIEVIIDYSLEERIWRDGELVRSDIELNKVQDADPKCNGTVSQWREYRKALRAWPEHKDFPKKEFRPRSPDFKE